MIDVNIKGVLYGIAAALPVFRKTGLRAFRPHRIHGRIDGRTDHSGLFGDEDRSARDFGRPTSGGGSQTRVTIVTPGFVSTELVESVTDPQLRDRFAALRDEFAIPPDAIARAIAFAIEQPADVDVNEIVIRPTAQG
jgi:NADP-dependent 3-hydroxy acid dehydrogenase YdfG